MLRFNPKGIVTVLGCSSAIVIAGAASLPQAATIAGSGGYVNTGMACGSTENPVPGGCYLLYNNNCGGNSLSACQGTGPGSCWSKVGVCQGTEPYCAGSASSYCK